MSGIPKKNPEGYNDPTAFAALNAIQTEQEEADIRCNRIVKTIKNMLDLAGYDLLNRIEIRDRSTGRIYR